MNLASVLEFKTIRVSVPCRVDFGGTLDISTFYLPLAGLRPSTLNIALDMRTEVTLKPFEPGRLKITSTGFAPVEFAAGQVAFNHPMGLMCAIVTHLGVHGVHVHIHSTSPPKSALGGSSSAAVAVIAALYLAMGKTLDPVHISWLGHYIESSVAGVPCGVQDQTAAAFGGVNLWEWSFGQHSPIFVQHPLYETEADLAALNDHILVAYCGVPHVSKDINGQWVKSFVRGETRAQFEDIARLTWDFYAALKERQFDAAARLMNRETLIRSEITPQVLDKTGKKLFERAKELSCGARFTGAGGGGCLWAVGNAQQIRDLAVAWKLILDTVDGARLLDTCIDPRGIVNL